MPLAPCRQCARHVRTVEERCPFCGCDAPAPHAAVGPPRPARRLGRAALFSLGTSLAVSGCRTRPTDPAVDTVTSDAGPRDAGAHDLSAPVDAAPLDASGDSAPQPIYGAPPRRDLGQPR